MRKLQGSAMSSLPMGCRVEVSLTGTEEGKAGAWRSSVGGAMEQNKAIVGGDMSSVVVVSRSRGPDGGLRAAGEQWKLSGSLQLPCV